MHKNCDCRDCSLPETKWTSDFDRASNMFRMKDQTQRAEQFRRQYAEHRKKEEELAKLREAEAAKPPKPKRWGYFSRQKNKEKKELPEREFTASWADSCPEPTSKPFTHSWAEMPDKNSKPQSARSASSRCNGSSGLGGKSSADDRDHSDKTEVGASGWSSNSKWGNKSSISRWGDSSSSSRWDSSSSSGSGWTNSSWVSGGDGGGARGGSWRGH